MRYIGTALFMLMFLGVMFGALFYVSMGMDMAGNPHGCPFMLEQQEVLCSMSITEHLSAWQSTFAALAAPLLQLMIVTILLIASIGPTLFAPVAWACRLSNAVIFRGLRKKLYTFCARPWQELFAGGLLHPRLFA